MKTIFHCLTALATFVASVSFAESEEPTLEEMYPEIVSSSRGKFNTTLTPAQLESRSQFYRDEMIAILCGKWEFLFSSLPSEVQEFIRNRIVAMAKQGEKDVWNQWRLLVYKKATENLRSIVNSTKTVDDGLELDFMLITGSISSKIAAIVNVASIEKLRAGKLEEVLSAAPLSEQEVCPVVSVFNQVCDATEKASGLCLLNRSVRCPVNSTWEDFEEFLLKNVSSNAIILVSECTSVRLENERWVFDISCSDLADFPEWVPTDKLNMSTTPSNSLQVLEWFSNPKAPDFNFLPFLFRVWSCGYGQAIDFQLEEIRKQKEEAELERKRQEWNSKRELQWLEEGPPPEEPPSQTTDSFWTDVINSVAPIVIDQIFN